MPLDYSKFENIEDSDDSEPGRRNLDIADFFPGGARNTDAEGDDSPCVSPREALAGRSSGAPAAARAAEPGDGAAPAASVERFCELARGAAVPARGEDAAELLAMARATAQSAAGEADADAADEGVGVVADLVQALAQGLEVKPKPVQFAKEQAPELVPELLCFAAGPSSSSAARQLASESERVLSLLLAKCRAQEVYTFLMEALSGDGMLLPARLRGVAFLRSVLGQMDEQRVPMFLGSCLPTLLKRTFGPSTPPEQLALCLEALREFAAAFVSSSPAEAGPASELDPSRVAQSMLCAFLLKVSQRALPLVFPVEALGLHEASAEALVFRRGGDVLPRGVEALCAAARLAAQASPEPILALLEEMDIGDPTGDGGGDLELCALSLSSYLLLLETPGCWERLRPHVLPVVLSPARRLNVVMRSCYVLVANQSDAPEAVRFGVDADEAVAAAPRWMHRGLMLFASVAAPLLATVAGQCPKAVGGLSGPLCRWHPQRAFRSLLEALAAAGEIDREARGALYRAMRGAMRHFAWPCRFELYRDVIVKCRVDSIIGAIVTLFKDDWWAQIQGLSPEDRPALAQERQRLVEVLKATLSGDLQIVDGMDTLTAALNICRLVALARAPAGATLRAALRRGGGAGLDLAAMLGGVSQQIDFELKLLDSPSGASPADVAQRAIAEALGQADGSVDVLAMKRDRIMMVAHLVSRAREVFASEE